MVDPYRRLLPKLLLLIAALAGVLPAVVDAQGVHRNSAAAPQSFGVLIRGGQVVDGSGAPMRRADVRIRGDSIIAVAPGLHPEPGERVVDATGMVVAPGFIDMHSHADRGIGRMSSAETQLRQGITTAVVGQDGSSALPVSEFFDEVDHLRTGINYASLIGHGTVRAAVLGADFHRAATPAEIETMKALVDRAMMDGAVGLSSGTEYDPGFFAEPAEIEALARVIEPYGGYYTSHVRDEEDGALAAWKEVINVGRNTGVPVKISHIKLASKSVWGKSVEGLKMIHDAQREGVQVHADWYPYTFWASSIYVLISDRDWQNRAKWEQGLDDIGGPQNVMVTGYRPDTTYNGRTIAEIAQSQGKDPITLIIDMMEAAGPGIGIMATAMQESDLENFARDSTVLISSDGGLTGAHPRGYGAFPRVLGVYVREKGLASLPAMISRMTSKSAHLLGFTDRGLLAPGKRADVVVFDATTISDRGTKQHASVPPIGVRDVIVNGELVLEGGNLTGARPGRALRRHNWKPYAVAR